MKNILILAPFTILKSEKGFNRFEYLAGILSSKGHDVTLVTSNFSHIEKKFRNIEEDSDNLSYRLIFFEELGYKNNVSVSRIVSHYYFQKKLKKWLNQLSKLPDIIYVAYPMMGSAYTAGKFAREKNIPFIMDIQDIWPESINNVFKLPSFLLNTILFPITIYANKIYSMADYLIAVSDTYLERASSANNILKNKMCVYIGTDLKYFDEIKGHVTKASDEFWATYIGTLSYSYDIPTLIKAAWIIKNEGYTNIKIKIFGSGPLELEYKRLNNKMGSPVEFVGHYNYNELIPLLNSSDVALNAITSHSTQSITNKIGDYVAAGLPIINSSSNKEFRKILNEYKIGVNYNAGDSMGLAKELIEFYNNPNLCQEYGKNARKLAEEKFDRRITYTSIVKLIESIY